MVTNSRDSSEVIISSNNDLETNYKDCSLTMNSETEQFNQISSESINISNLKHAATNFPVKLHYMLDELEKDGLHDIISWQPHGRCIMIHKQKELEDTIIPL